VNILDENIGRSQCQQLAAWKIHFRRIGVEIGRQGLKDREEIIPLLHRLKRPTFFTLDRGFYHPTLRYQEYCLVFLDVWEDHTAEYIRRFLRHTAFRTRSQRMGKVVRLRHSSMSYWQVHQRGERVLAW